MIATNDKIIRKSLLEKLNRKYGGDPDTRIIEELGLKNGEARVDLAVVNGIIHGYELKSDLDTLIRLPDQMKTYNLILDEITLVVGRDHLYEAVKIVPDWWGIVLAKKSSLYDRVEFVEMRKSEANPVKDSMALASLLWRKEVLEILEKRKLATGLYSKPRKVLYERLAAAVTQNELSEYVRYYLKFRPNWRFAQ